MPPLLYALILSGGQSLRMGEDKGLLKYHGEEQIKYIQKLLSPICEKVFISCRKNQANLPIYKALPLIIDQYDNCGAMAGILSAFKQNPDVAWLVLACDMPQFNQESIQTLITQRNPQEHASSFQPSTQDFPEPLCTIYEPSAYQEIQKAHKAGRYAMVKLLKSLKPSLIPIDNASPLININTKEEYLEKINNK